jgi:hypothetical protein
MKISDGCRLVLGYYREDRVKELSVKVVERP